MCPACTYITLPTRAQQWSLLCSGLAEVSGALGDLPHVPLLGHPSQPEPLVAAARASGIDSFEVRFLLLCMLLPAGCCSPEATICCCLADCKVCMSVRCHCLCTPTAS
jgi:hypothetical protein